MKKDVTVASCYVASTVKTPEEWSKPGTGFTARSYKLTKAGLDEARQAMYQELDKFLDTAWEQFDEDNQKFN